MELGERLKVAISMASGHNQHTGENGIEIKSIVRHMYIRNDSVTAELAEFICSEDFDSQLEGFLEKFSYLDPIAGNSHSLIHCLANTKPLVNGPECREGNLAKIVSVLVERGVNLDAQDDTGNTALHYAAKNEDKSCSDALIREGADLCLKNFEGASAISDVLKHLPNSFKAIEERLDRGLILSQKDLQNEDPISYGKRVKLDFNVLLSKTNEHLSSGNILGEIIEWDEANKSIIDVERKYLEKVFLHPLTECFLFFKWHRVRLQYWAHLLCHLTFSLFYSAYLYVVYGRMCKPLELAPKWNGTIWIKQSHNASLLYEIPCEGDLGNGETSTTGAAALWVIMLVFISIYIMKEISLMFYLKSRYFLSWDNRLSVLLLITFPLIILHHFPMSTMTDDELDSIKWNLTSNYKGITAKYYQYHVAAIGILLTWILNMSYVAQSPIFGHYVHMMVKVSINFFKLFIAVSSLLIAFATSFSVLFPRYVSASAHHNSKLMS